MFHHLVNYPTPALGLGLYAIIRSRSTGKVYNDTAMVDWVDVDYGTYTLTLTYTGGSVYGFEVPADLPKHDDYLAEFRVPVAPDDEAIGDTKLPDEWEFHWTGKATAAGAPGDPVGSYTDKTSFDLWNGGSGATDVETDSDNDGPGNPEILQEAITNGESYINRYLRAYGFLVPLTGMDDNTARDLKDVANHATRMMLADQLRFAVYVGEDEMTEKAQRGIYSADKKYVDNWLKLVEENPGVIVATAPPTPTTSTPTKTGAISVVVGPAKLYPGTGCVRPVALTLPSVSD